MDVFGLASSLTGGLVCGYRPLRPWVDGPLVDPDARPWRGAVDCFVNAGSSSASGPGFSPSAKMLLNSRRCKKLESLSSKCFTVLQTECRRVLASAGVIAPRRFAVDYFVNAGSSETTGRWFSPSAKMVTTKGFSYSIQGGGCTPSLDPPRVGYSLRGWFIAPRRTRWVGRRSMGVISREGAEPPPWTHPAGVVGPLIH